MKTFFLKSDLTTGGRITPVPLVSAPKELFPNITQAQARFGLVDYQKVFIKQEKSLAYKLAFLSNPACNVVDLSIHPGTASDIVTDAQGYTGWKGCGILLDDILALYYFLPFRVSVLLPGYGFSNLDRLIIVDGDFTEKIQIA